MTEHLLPKQIEDWRLRRLAPEELLRVDDHLAGCAECRWLFDTSMNDDAMALYAEFSACESVGEHLNFEWTAAFVDGLLTGDERRTVEDHLASCAECAPLVADLRAFRNKIAPDLEREYRPAKSVAAAGAPGHSGLSDRMRSLIPAPFLKIPVWIYAAAPVLTLLAIAGWFAWRASTKPAPIQITGVTPTPAPSPSRNVATPPPEITPALVRLNDGAATLTLDAQGRLAGADQWPPEYQELVKDALLNQRVVKSSLLSDLNRPDSALMGTDDQGARFALIDPSGKIILSVRPTFRWSKLSGATGYIVEVYDSRFIQVYSSPTVTGESWNGPPLARGKVYYWQVKAIKDGQKFIAPRPPAPQARFRVLDQPTADEITRAKRDHASSRLLLGLLYARAGLLDEAKQELGALQKANPDVPVASKLLANVRSPRRRILN